VTGRRVLDIVSGSGLVAIAAARAGAASVVANDIDPYAVAAIRANARANGVDVRCVPDDLLGGDADADVILAGDGLYEKALAARMLAFLGRQAARGCLVLVGDPGRGHVETSLLECVATYDHPHLGPAEDHQRPASAVYRARAQRPSPTTTRTAAR
jgi:predicted nicotinamide N-methyase